MFARLTAKAIFSATAIAMAFFGVGLLGMALAGTLTASLGMVGGYAVAGAVLLAPPLLWALITRLSQASKPSPPANRVHAVPWPQRQRKRLWSRRRRGFGGRREHVSKPQQIQEIAASCRPQPVDKREPASDGGRFWP
jgi:NhaP-type Na+/H+ or K+/H+ antiporter